MRKGWGKILNLETKRITGKYHYFQDGTALCGKYMLEGGDGFLEDKNHYSEKNCKICAIERVRLLKESENANSK